MKKIVFGITSLQLGGAERVLVDIVNSSCDKFDITIFTLYGKGKFKKELNKKIKVIELYKQEYSELNKLEKIKISLSLQIPFLKNKIYKKYIKDKYDVEVAFLEGPITWLFASKGKSKKITWVHNDIKNVFGSGLISKLKKIINRKSYEKYDKIIFVSNDNLSKFKEEFKNNKVLKKVIYNYLDKEKIISKSKEFIPEEIKHDYPSFIQVSRLVEQKALFRLLDVHKKLIEEGIKHYIYIVGEGPLYKELNEKINNYKLKDTFILLGKKQNPYPYIKNCDNFILTSYYEGYGMVVIEAEILSKRIMITNTAAREAVLNYKNSLIVENNEQDIYLGMKKLLKEKNKDINYKFNNDEILKQLEELFMEE